MSRSVLPSTPGACVAPEGHCITCADEGTPMRVLEVGDEDGLARCAEDSGACREVEVALVGSVRPGDWVLVHAATAIARLAEGSPA